MTKQAQSFIPASRDQIRALEGAKRQEKEYNVDFSIIDANKAMNGREQYGNLQELAENIDENGLLQPLLGFFVTNDKGVVRFVLVDGFRRYYAIEILVKSGKEVGQIPCRIKVMSVEERLFTMFNTQNNLPLSEIEISNVFRRLVNLGIDVKTIAQKVSKSTTFIQDMLVLSAQTESVKNAVTNKQTSATAVVNTAKKLGADKTKELVEKSINHNKKYTVRDSQEAIETPKPEPQIKYGKTYKEIPKTLQGMIIVRDELLALPERSKKQLHTLNELIPKIKLREDAEKENVVNTPDPIEFKEGIEFNTILYTEYCSTFCELIGMDNSIATFKWWKNKYEGKQ